MFIDVQKKFKEIKSIKTKDRVIEFCNNYNGVYISAICSIPIKEINNEYYHSNNKIDNKYIDSLIKESLGLSGMLSFMNKSNFSLEKMGEVCIDKKHYWGFNWINISFLFINYPIEVQLAFARDCRFFLSWPEVQAFDSKIFMATSSVSSWSRYLSFRNDISFDENTRKAMNDTYNVFSQIIKQ